MPDKQTLTDQQLIECLTTDQLSNDQIIRRGHLISMQAAEVNRDKLRHENELFKSQAEHRAMMQRARVADIDANHAKVKASQDACTHKSGGFGLEGLSRGDGDLYGYVTYKEKLPTGSTYVVCGRCSREWHSGRYATAYYPGSGSTELMTRVKAVIVGALPLSEFCREEREWREAMNWQNKIQDRGSNGEIPSGVKFRIPKLAAQLDNENREFLAHLKTLPAKTLAEAGVTEKDMQMWQSFSAITNMSV